MRDADLLTGSRAFNVESKIGRRVAVARRAEGCGRIMDEITKAFARHYGEKIEAHGPTARGLDWGADSDVRLRYRNMLDVVRAEDRGTSFSLLDVGCGYGGLLDQAVDLACDYTGIDLVERTIAHGRELHRDASFVVGDVLSHDFGGQTFDYVVCSGILTLKLTASIKEMNDYFHRIVRRMFALSRKGIAFNVMTNHVNFVDPKLFYRSPVEVLAFCLSELSPKVRLDHAYPLYEFTTYVYRESA